MGNRYLSKRALAVCQTVCSRNGDVAQLVERLLCKQEVDGSIPFISTEEEPSLRRGFFRLRFRLAISRPKIVSEGNAEED
jgi:hypothetical protein